MEEQMVTDLIVEFLKLPIETRGVFWRWLYYQPAGDAERGEDLRGDFIWDMRPVYNRCEGDTVRLEYAFIKETSPEEKFEFARLYLNFREEQQL